MKDLKQVEKTTGRRPKELDEEPEIWPENQEAIDAWTLLFSGERNTPLAEIECYARLKGIGALALAEKVRAVDREYFAAETLKRKWTSQK